MLVNSKEFSTEGIPVRYICVTEESYSKSV